MKILSMNCKNRMDLPLIRELMYIFKIFDMNLLAYSGAKILPMVLPFMSLSYRKWPKHCQGRFVKFPSLIPGHKFCSEQITWTKVCNDSICLTFTFNQINKKNITQSKCQSFPVRHYHGQNQRRKTRVQQTQYRIHQFQTELHIFFCKAQQLVFQDFVSSFTRTIFFKTINEHNFWSISCQIQDTRFEILFNNFWSDFFPCFQNPFSNSTMEREFGNWKL